jgi:RNA recognition motif-containing protein
VGYKVFVGNLSYRTDWKALKDFMRTSGSNVLHADVFLDRTGRSKGCGYRKNKFKKLMENIE